MYNKSDVQDHSLSYSFVCKLIIHKKVPCALFYFSKSCKVVLVISVIVGISGIVTADSRKITDQVELTLDNAPKELENILNTDEKKLTYDTTFPEGEKLYENKSGDLYFFGDDGKITEYVSNTDTITFEQTKINETDL